MTEERGKVRGGDMKTLWGRKTRLQMRMIGNMTASNMFHICMSIQFPGCEVFH